MSPPSSHVVGPELSSFLIRSSSASKLKDSSSSPTPPLSKCGSQPTVLAIQPRTRHSGSLLSYDDPLLNRVWSLSLSGGFDPVMSFNSGNRAELSTFPSLSRRSRHRLVLTDRQSAHSNSAQPSLEVTAPQSSQAVLEYRSANSFVELSIFSTPSG